jgi:hypothetical protein
MHEPLVAKSRRCGTGGISASSVIDPRYLSVKVPACLLEIIEEWSTVLFTCPGNILDTIAKAESKAPCLDDFDGLIGGILATIVGRVIDVGVRRRQ